MTPSCKLGKAINLKLKPVKLVLWFGIKCGSWCHVHMFMLFLSPDFCLVNENRKHTFCHKNLTVKFDAMCNIFSQPSFQTITFVFMLKQRSGNKKHINTISKCKWYFKQEDQICRQDSHCRFGWSFAPFTRVSQTPIFLQKSCRK